MALSQNYRSFFLSLSRQFQQAENPRQALSVAADLCSALADLSGELEPLRFPGFEYEPIEFNDLAVDRAVWIDSPTGEKERVEVIYIDRFSLSVVCRCQSGGLIVRQAIDQFYVQV